MRVIKEEENKTLMFIIPLLCPNCSKMNDLIYDEIHDETVCKNCGLVVAGPPVHGIKYPIGFKIIIGDDGLVLRELIIE